MGVKKIKSLDKKAIIGFLVENKLFLLRRFGFKEIFLYGSYAKNKASKESDVDILVDIDKSKKTYQNFLDAEAFLSEHLNSNVDLVYLDSLNPIIAIAIQNEVIRVE